MIDRRPGAIVRCADVADVITAVNFARNEDIAVARWRSQWCGIGRLRPPFPEELHRKTMCGIVWAYCGPLEELEDTFRPIREFRTPKFDLMGLMPYPALQGMFDAIYPSGLQWYWRGDSLSQVPDAAIEEHLKFAEQLPTLHSTMHLYPIDGAASRIDRHETAFSYRDAKWSLVIVGVDPDPANAEKITAWTKGYWAALHPHSLGGAYVNFMMDEGIDRVKATYRDNYDRLLKIKQKYDPNNFFRINQNITTRSARIYPER
jgi:FAD/FMN-containing dehydrogenase